MTITLKPRATYQNGIWTCWTDTDAGRRIGTGKTLEQALADHRSKVAA